jgi:hypothetical protein
LPTIATTPSYNHPRPEMGFSVSQVARKTLSTTKDGMDVQTALKSHLNLSDGSSSSGNEEREKERERDQAGPQQRVPPPTRDEPPPRAQAPRNALHRKGTKSARTIAPPTTLF